MFLSEWREFPSAPCLAGKKTWQLASRCCWNLARRLICSRACFLPARAKYLSAPVNTPVISSQLFSPLTRTYEYSTVRFARNVGTCNPDCRHTIAPKATTPSTHATLCRVARSSVPCAISNGCCGTSRCRTELRNTHCGHIRTFRVSFSVTSLGRALKSLNCQLALCGSARCANNVHLFISGFLYIYIYIYIVKVKVK